MIACENSGHSVEDDFLEVRKIVDAWLIFRLQISNQKWKGSKEVLFNKKRNHGIDINFDPEVHKAVLKCSICNGEQVAGFKNMSTGEFQEVMLIRNGKELDLFMERYNLTCIVKEY